jgi:hypothetical protein
MEASTYPGISLAEGFDDGFGSVDGPTGAVKGGGVPSLAPTKLAAAETGDFLAQEGVNGIELNRSSETLFRRILPIDDFN